MPTTTTLEIPREITHQEIPMYDDIEEYEQDIIEGRRKGDTK